MLLRLCNGILASPTDPKPRTLKATSKILRTTLLDLPANGGHHCLVALNFKRKVVQFEEVWSFEEGRTDDKGRVSALEGLEIARGVLSGKEKEIRERLIQTTPKNLTLGSDSTRDSWLNRGTDEILFNDLRCFAGVFFTCL